MESVDVLRLSDKVISGFLKQTKNMRNTAGIIGYASALEQIAQYLDRTVSKKLLTNISSIIAISETLSPDTKYTLNKYFEVPVISRYSNVENGILAQQCSGGKNEFHLNQASYFFEIIDMEKNISVPEGELGRIVITDLYNYGFPMVRYDTGDIGAISSHSDCCFGTPVLTRLEGRKLDLLYNASGELLSSLLVYRNMWKYTEIKQYQLIQRGKKDYILRINIDKKFTRENELIDEYKEFLGKSCQYNCRVCR